MKKIVYSNARGKMIVELTPEEIEQLEKEEDTDYSNILRSRRNRLLSESDIFVLPDRWEKYTTAQKKAWSDYREALRNLPETTIDPKNPAWPTKPE